MSVRSGARLRGAALLHRPDANQRQGCTGEIAGQMADLAMLP